LWGEEGNIQRVGLSNKSAFQPGMNGEFQLLSSTTQRRVIEMRALFSEVLWWADPGWQLSLHPLACSLPALLLLFDMQEPCKRRI